MTPITLQLQYVQSAYMKHKSNTRL